MVDRGGKNECEGIGVDVPTSAGANDIDTMLGFVVVLALRGDGPHNAGVVLVPLEVAGGDRVALEVAPEGTVL